MTKILVVDPEAHVVRLLQVNLQRAGYEVCIAHSSPEAMEKVKAEKPELDHDRTPDVRHGRL